MGGKRSKKKKTKTAAQKAAAARHAKFKQTKVQTFGGKRKNFSKKEEARIKKAGYSVAGYSSAAPNKASGYSGTTGVSIGSKIKNPNPKISGVGPVADGSEYAAMLKANPPRFKEADKTVASAFSAGSGLFGDDIDVGDGVFRTKDQIKKMYLNPGNFNLQPGDRLYKQIQEAGKGLVNRPTDNKIALGGDNLGSMFGVGSVLGAGLAIPSIIKKSIESGNELRKNLERKLNPEESQNQSSLGISNALASTGNLTGMGIGTTPTYFSIRSPDSYGAPSQAEVDKAAGITAGGLNVGGSGFTPDNPSDPNARAIQNYKSTLNPNSFKGLSDGETFGSGPVISGDDYARGLNVSPYGSVENTMRSVVGKIPGINMIPGVNTRLLTDKEIADKRISAQNQLAYRKEMSKIKKGASGGGARPLAAVPTVIEEILPEALPVPSASTTPTTQTGVDPNRLLQIQQQAYAQAYNPMLIGGFNPQFRFGAATPTIDYSTYFNY